MLNKALLKIDEKLNGKSIKDILLFFHVGKGKIEELRSKKGLRLNKKECDLSTTVNINDIVEFISEEKEVLPSKNDIQVLYEDDYYIAVYKEKGILVHSDGNNNDTLINRVGYYLQNKNENHVLYPVHRIDVDTSGIVLFSKNFLSGCAIDKMVENHEITKVYLLWVKGVLKSKKGTLNFDLGRDRHNSKKMIVKKSNGLKAITHYEVLKEEKGNSFIKAQIVTGRKHQIRVSFAHINHPIIGDDLYGKKEKEKLSLEASYLSFVHPIKNLNIEIKTSLFINALKLKS